MARRRSKTPEEYRQWLKAQKPREYYRRYINNLMVGEGGHYWRDACQKKRVRDNDPKDPFCEVCGHRAGGGISIVVHHKTYDHLGDEITHLDDLEVLCEPHHIARHTCPHCKERSPSPEVCSSMIGCMMKLDGGYFFVSQKEQIEKNAEIESLRRQEREEWDRKKMAIMKEKERRGDSSPFSLFDLLDMEDD